MKLLEIADDRWHYMYVLELQGSAGTITSMYDGDPEIAKKLKDRVPPALDNEQISRLMRAVEHIMDVEWIHIFRTSSGVAFFFSWDKNGAYDNRISERFSDQIHYELRRMNKQMSASSWMQDIPENRAKFVRRQASVENITSQIL